MGQRYQCSATFTALGTCSCAARVPIRRSGCPLSLQLHPCIIKRSYGRSRVHDTRTRSVSSESVSSPQCRETLHDSIREAWQAYRVSHISERQTTCDSQTVVLTEFLGTFVGEYNDDRREALLQLPWDDTIKLFWIASYPELKNANLDQFLDIMIPIVRDKVETREQFLSHRLSLSLLMASLRLDALEDVIGLLSFNYESLRTCDILQLCYIYAQGNQYEITDAFGKELSRRLSRGLLEEIQGIGYLDLLNHVSKLKWNPSIKEKKMMFKKAEAWRIHLTASNIASLVQLLNRPPHLSAEDMRQVSSLISDRLRLCRMKELGVIAKVYSRFHHDISSAWTAALFDDIAAHATTCVDSADPKDMVRLIQAFQYADLKPEGLLDVLDIWADKRLASMNAQGISLAMAHFARIGEASERLLQTAVTVAESTMDQMSSTDASRLIWAFARLEYNPGDTLLQEGIHILQSSVTATDLSDRDTANLFWGIVKLGKYPSAAENSNIVSNLYRTPGKLSGQSAALLLWSFASAQDGTGITPTGQKFYSTIYRLGMEVYRDINLIDSQSVSMTAWSLGVLRVPHKEFVSSLDQLISSNRLNSFEPQHISNLLWGLAKSGAHPSEEVLDSLVQALSGNLHTYSPQELFNVFWSYATLKFSVPSIIAEVILELEIRGTEFQGLELCGLTWSLSRLLSMQHQQDRDGISKQLATRTAHVIDKELPKHMADLEASQLAMAVVGLARISELDSSIDINPSLIDVSLDNFTKHITRNEFSINSVNTVLEGLQILGKPLPQGLHLALRSTITVSMLSKVRTWEACDLCYNTCMCNLVDFSLDILVFIDEQIAHNQRITPRASIMLLHTMSQLDSYPSATLLQTTSKLASLSPNYNLSDKWLAVLAQTRKRLPMDIKQMLELHPDWEAKLSHIS